MGGGSEGRKQRWREGSPVGRKICGTGGEPEEKDKNQFTFYLLRVFLAG